MTGRVASTTRSLQTTTTTKNLFVIGSVFPKVENIEVDLAECQALAKHMKAEVERIIVGSKTYTP